VAIHHITAIAGDPDRNLRFYTRTLGLRLVKLTVNYDDPGTYHFYFGDELGRPGSLLTFFPWDGGRPGRQGTGQINGVALAIPQGSLGYWVERLLSRGVKYEGPSRRFGEQVLAFADPDGMMLELVAAPSAAGLEGRRDGPVPAEHAIRGVRGITIWEDGDAGSAAFLTGTMGYTVREEADNRVRLESGSDRLGSVVELRRAPGFWRGTDSLPSMAMPSGRSGRCPSLSEPARDCRSALSWIVPESDWRSRSPPDSRRRKARTGDGLLVCSLTRTWHRSCSSRCHCRQLSRRQSTSAGSSSRPPSSPLGE
jgi:catechol 2,3-dioxygenase-like lactoylglutathione lyase family enzyme